MYNRFSGKDAIEAEAETIVALMFNYYEEYHLLICKSQGSRLEAFYDELVEIQHVRLEHIASVR